MAVINGVLHPDLEFISSKKYRNGFLWEVRKRREPQPCRRCGLYSSHRYGKATVLVRERSPFEKPLWLKVLKHKYYCSDCKKPFTELTPGTYLYRRSTERFRVHVRKLCDKFTTLKSVGEEAFCSSGFVYKTYYEQLKIKTYELKSRSWPSVVGIDEHFFTRRNGYPEYVTVFTNLNKRKLFEVAPTKSKNQLLEQFMPTSGRDNVKVVCIDLASTYKSLAKKLFPNAQIVADKFHVLRLLMPELMKERQKILSIHKKQLSRKRLLANRSKLDYWVRYEIDQALKNYPQLNELYRAKEMLQTLYKSKGFLRAYQSHRKIMKWLETTTHPKLKTLYKTLKSWRDEILNYFIYKVTNAVTEAINGNAKALQRRARGYKVFKNYRMALLNACAF